VSQLMREADGSHRATKTLRTNTAPLLGVALFILAAWVTNASEAAGLSRAR